jgi:hypothetical protein
MDTKVKSATDNQKGSHKKRKKGKEKAEVQGHSEKKSKKEKGTEEVPPTENYWATSKVLRLLDQQETSDEPVEEEEEK